MSAPTHFAYSVREYRVGKEMKSYWTEIGPLFAHKDGKGFNLDLNLLPRDGKVVIRVADERPKRTTAATEAAADTAKIDGSDDIPV